MKRSSNLVARKGGGSGSTERRAPGLLEVFRLAVNQRRLGSELCDMAAAATESIFEPITSGASPRVSEKAQPASSGADGLSQ
eukprot:3124119-Pleurochrysis_carterae.AAC.1